MSDQKKRRVDSTRDPEMWKRWFDEMSSGEESPVDEEDKDKIENDVGVGEGVADSSSDHNTKSELDVSEREVSDHGEKTKSVPQTFILGKIKRRNGRIPEAIYKFVSVPTISSTSTRLER